jgi:hypothetical protein
MTEKFCRDCKHRDNSLPFYCYHPDNGIDPVMGKPKSVSCVKNRGFGSCGPAGRLFEGREPEPYRPPAWARFIKRVWSWIK